MRPQGGVLECVQCSRRNRARTVMTKGRAIRVQHGQSALAQRSEPGSDPPLTPTAPAWRPPEPRDSGAPHPHLGLFPHDEMRTGQRSFARDVTMAVQQGTHLVAHAPTGIGKTAAALAPALQHALDAKKTVFFLTSRQSQHRIAVETLRQVQARRGARFTLVDLVAKRDMCLRPEAAEMHPARFPDFCARETRTRSCQYLGDADEGSLAAVRDGVLHVEELMQVGKQAALCPHILALAAATQAQVVVADYNHLFSDIREQSLERLGVKLADIVLIVDEAHNLPERIRRNHAHRITDFLLEQVKAEARRHKLNDIDRDCDAIRECLIELAADAEKEGRAEAARLGEGSARVARVEIQALHDAFAKSRNAGTLGLHRTLQDVIDDLGPLVRKVRAGQADQIFSEQLQETLDDWGRFRAGGLRYVEWDDAGGISLHVRLLDAAIPALQVFDEVHAAVLMSGTLRPPEMFRDLLGLVPERTAVRTYESPFSPEHRAVIVGRGFTTRFNARSEEMWSRMAATIADVAAATKNNVAVFAPSYRILADVRAAMPAMQASTRPGLATRPAVQARRVTADGRDIVEDPTMTKSERDGVLDRLDAARRQHRPAILWGVMGGSFSEGIDFRDNLLGAIVVVGLPLAPPDLEVEATIGYLESRFRGKGRLYGYVYPAMQKALQAMGRGIRSETDRCAVLLLDERYLQSPYRAIVPPAVPSTDPAFTATTFLAAHGV